MNILPNQSRKVDEISTIRIVELKQRDEEIWVTYEISNGIGIPRILKMGMTDFVNAFGALFE